MSNVLTISIGNTRVAVGIFKTPLPRGIFKPFFAQAFPLAKKFDANLPARKITSAVLCSVNPAYDQILTAWAVKKFGVAVTRFPQQVTPHIKNRYRKPQTVGADRLANLVAAHREFRQNCIVIDAGTAVTVDAVDAAGVFQGGAIFPGLGLWPKALASNTALLPEVRLLKSRRVAALSTEEGISSGILRGLAGAIDRIATDMADEIGGCDNYVVTGGDSLTIMKFSKLKLAHRPWLAIAGLAVSMGC